MSIEETIKVFLFLFSYLQNLQLMRYFSMSMLQVFETFDLHWPQNSSDIQM